jgi:hypothetical protein
MNASSEYIDVRRMREIGKSGGKEIKILVKIPLKYYKMKRNLFLTLPH